MLVYIQSLDFFFKLVKKLYHDEEKEAVFNGLYEACSVLYIQNEGCPLTFYVGITPRLLQLCRGAKKPNPICET